MAITDIIEESEVIDTGAPSIKYEGDRPLKKQEMLMAGPDWYIKRIEHLMYNFDLDYEEAGEIAYDSEKYYEYIGHDPYESRIMDEEVVEEEGIMRAAHGGVAIQGGVKNYKPSKMVNVPKTAKSSPTHPTAHLAYITDAEKKLLIKKNLHGSLKGKPNRGPGGIPSLQGDFGGGDTYSSPSDSHKSSNTSGGSGKGRQDKMGSGYWDQPQNKKKLQDQQKRIREMQEKGQGIFADDKTKTVTTTGDEGTPDWQPEDSQLILNKTYLADQAKKKKKMAKWNQAAFDEQWGKEDSENFGFDRFDKNKDGKLSWGEKREKAKLERMQKSSFDKYQQMEPFVGFDDYGSKLSGEELSAKQGFTKNPDGSYSYDRDFFRDDKGGIKEEFIGTDSAGNKFIDIPGYDFRGRESFYKDGKLQNAYGLGKPTLTSNRGTPIESTRPNEYPLQQKTGTYWDAIGQIMNPDDQIGAFNTLQDARVIGDFASRYKGGDESAYDEFIEYKDRFKPPVGGGGDQAPENKDPCKGPNPPAYCFTGGKNQTDEEDDWQLGLAFRADGGRVPAAFGGLMGNDGRRAYGLGSIFKKVGKIFKSPLGKAALLGLGGWKAGLFGGTGGGWLSGIKSKGLSKWLGEIPLSKVAGGIGLASLGAGMLAKGYQDEDGDGYDDKTGIDINKLKANPYGNSSLAFSADGGRIGYASGTDIADISGDPEYRGWKKMYEINPDAASMHPKHSDFVKYYTNVDRQSKAEGGLMDLGGMEKDYRQDGGFVPIGGKERADDVPARLSKNEFVFTADAVRNAGGGDIDKGSEVMYNVMKNLEAGGDVSEDSQGLDGAREMFQTSQRLEEVL
jgi:hypothetical protein